MDKESNYFKRASFMLGMIPYVASENFFALKVGNAINFFHCDMSHLSIDVDLAYLPIEQRELSLQKISQVLPEIDSKIRNSGLEVQEGRLADHRTTKLFVSDGKSRVTIEPKEVIRGTVHLPKEQDTSDTVEKAFELSASIRVLHITDLDAGKRFADLDPQHPINLFDVKVLLKNV